MLRIYNTVVGAKLVRRKGGVYGTCMGSGGSGVWSHKRVQRVVNRAPVVRIASLVDDAFGFVRLTEISHGALCATQKQQPTFD